MRFHHFALALATCLASGWAPAHGADNTATLRKALGHFPETILATLATSDPMPIAYLDVGALARAENGALSDAALRRLAFAGVIRPLETLRYGMGKGWTEKAGIAFADISWFAGNGMPPARLAAWGLADDAAAARLFETLLSRGFREIQAVPRLLANGEPRAINFDAMDPDNPWSGELGQTSVVTIRRDALLQASAPDVIRPTLEMTRSVADNAAIAIALDGLARAPASKDASIVQALVILPLFGLSAVDVSDLLLEDLTDMDAARKKMEAKLLDSSRGVPPYLAGIVVDAQQPGGPALVVSLAYADCAAAEIALTTIQTRWSGTMDPARSAGMSGDAVPGSNGECAAVLSIAAKADVNEPMLDAYSHYLGRTFNFLQIGTSK
jgi:hypothetical protein